MNRIAASTIERLVSDLDGLVGFVSYRPESRTLEIEREDPFGGIGIWVLVVTEFRLGQAISRVAAQIHSRGLDLAHGSGDGAEDAYQSVLAAIRDDSRFPAALGPFRMDSLGRPAPMYRDPDVYRQMQELLFPLEDNED